MSGLATHKSILLARQPEYHIFVKQVGAIKRLATSASIIRIFPQAWLNSCSARV
jgi:hypothetical protein